MRAGVDIDQLSADAHERTGMLLAAFENVAYAELLPDLPDVEGLTLVGHCNATRDDKGIANPRQQGRQAIGDRIGKMVVRVTAAQIDERQYDEREAPAMELSGGEAADMAASNGFVRRLIRSPNRDRGLKDVPSSWHGPDGGLIGILQGEPDVADAPCQGFVCHGHIRPDRFNNFALGDEPSGVLDEIAQDFEALGPQFDLPIV